ncbi:hypothetical protein QBC44DRAFT_405029 [Cladorrhinum sp. PSN332]|nr:hypothetical protein QBC44DRAFT_405029 [Cladorrhinum sp. PSN332]
MKGVIISSSNQRTADCEDNELIDQSIRTPQQQLSFHGSSLTAVPDNGNFSVAVRQFAELTLSQFRSTQSERCAKPGSAMVDQSPSWFSCTVLSRSIIHPQSARQFLEELQTLKRPVADEGGAGANQDPAVAGPSIPAACWWAPSTLHYATFDKASCKIMEYRIATKQKRFHKPSYTARFQMDNHHNLGWHRQRNKAASVEYTTVAASASLYVTWHTKRGIPEKDAIWPLSKVETR